MSEILDIAFMQRALIAAVLVGITAPLVGVFIVQRRMALIGDGLGHIALAGVALGTLASQSPVWVALVTCVAAAVCIEVLRMVAKTGADVAVAVLFYGGIAAGVVLLSMAGTAAANLTSYLFGSIVTTSTEDIVAFSVLTGLVVVLIGLFGSRIFAVGNDDEYATAMGMPTLFLNILLTSLVATTVVLSMRVIGVLLISALMVLPAAAANRLAGSFASTLAIAVGMGITMSVGGVVLSYHADTPPGGTVVLLGIAVFIVSVILASVGRRALPALRSQVSSVR